MRPRKPRIKKGAPAWMVTFSDLMTLILVFFILLFAASTIDAVKFRAISDSFQQRDVFEFYPSVVSFEEPNEDTDQETEATEAIEVDAEDAEMVNKLKENRIALEEVLKVINVYLEENELEHVISATKEESGIVMVLQDRVLFKSGEAEILTDVKDFLDRLGVLLNTIPNQIRVEGHTDNIPIATDRYPSNWELSTARASGVIRYFIDQNGVDPTRLVAIGYGEHRPVDTNTIDEGRQKNRRVVIVITDPSEQLEPLN
jgi:chemotaxis protein MotB